MVTFVGTQSDFLNALNDLLELEYEALEIYEAAINRLENEKYADKLREFKSDHQKHVDKLTTLIKDHGKDPAVGPSGGQVLAISNIAIRKLIGDESVLKGLYGAEKDTNTAYERINNHPDKFDDAVQLLKSFWEDEKKHKAWIESIVNK
jgi:rubrerythrin